MESYELTLVLPRKATPAKIKSATQLIEKLVKISKGKVVKTDSWVEIDLAYKVKKNESGSFLYFDLELPKESVKDIDDKLRLEESAIRYLLVKKEK